VLRAAGNAIGGSAGVLRADQIMTSGVFNVLFLCTGNSARSIIAESVLNHMGEGRYRAFSAGSYPSGAVNPLVLEFLEQQHMPTTGARSKNWDEFAAAGGPRLDFVITVCDDAAGEVCPVWPGQPVTAHWGVEDPARFMDDPERARKVINDVFHTLHRRIQLFTSLPASSLDRLALTAAVRDIGRQTTAAEV
jgi:arsenate reductase (thioredoxin)